MANRRSSFKRHLGEKYGYDLEGFDTEIKRVTVDVRASQIVAVKTPIAIAS